AGFFFMDRVLPSDDGRGLAFSADGNRAYVLNREPAMLQVLDTSLAPGGQPRNELVRTVEVCRDASYVAVADAGAGERVYVPCFRTGQLWVIDPAAGVVEAAIDVGSGPHAVVAAIGRKQVYVTNFHDDSVTVIDITPDVPSENRVVL